MIRLLRRGLEVEGLLTAEDLLRSDEVLVTSTAAGSCR